MEDTRPVLFKHKMLPHKLRGRIIHSWALFSFIHSLEAMIYGNAFQVVGGLASASLDGKYFLIGLPKVGVYE